ncbi:MULTISPECIES: hypothetical protein [unclassified Caulobacter]|uniref:hypothetical protein n=1 Tax=unclassified Caulobacter TaxID=2648921 RepID=UPI000D3A4CC0|nr:MULTISPECIES: hypothetical protein [unclassified Caulobacter]PTS81695.1 hypothetical protein DBR21_18855 [Caulobacter sp. HMWF009]PTT06100.1 hypothetical protein DBR10_14015 [Caulobacter sp. HMWF025]
MVRWSPPLLATLSLTAAGPALAGETACWFENGAVVAPAAVADMTGDFVIDLSAPQTLLHDTKAQTGGYAGTRLTLPVRVAGERVEAVPLEVRDLDYRSAGFIAPIIGVIGADILDRYVVVIDFAPCRLRLEARGPAVGRRPGAMAVTVVGGIPTVRATASDGFRSLSGAFALDTASNGAVRARGAPDGPRQAPAGVLAGLTLNGRLYQRSPAVQAGDLPPGVAGAVGVAVLSAYQLRLDMNSGQLWLTPRPAP